MVMLLYVFQSSLFKQVEEMEQDSLITLNIERLIGTYGRVTVEWIANGSISDIFPASGMVCNVFSGIREALTVLPQTAGADVLREDSRCQIAPFLVLCWDFGSFHFWLQHHSHSPITRYCNAVQAIQMHICNILFLSSFFPSMKPSCSVKSSALVGIWERLLFLLILSIQLRASVVQENVANPIFPCFWDCLDFQMC